MDTLLLNKLLGTSAITALVGQRVYPTRPTGDTVLPFVVYTLASCDGFPHLQGAGSLHRYEYTLDYWAVDQAPCLTLGDAIHAALDGWRDDDVQGCFRTSTSNEPEEVGYHGSQTYAIFGG